MRVLTALLCGICLTGGAVTGLAVMQDSSRNKPTMPIEADSSAIPSPRRQVDAFDLPVPRSDEDGFKTPPESLPDPLPLDRPDDSFSAPLDRDLPELETGIPKDDFGPPRDGNIPVPRQRNTSDSVTRVRQVRETIVREIVELVPPEELAAAKKLRAAIQSLKTSTDADARRKAADVIQQQLSAQFDLDLKQREKELSEVEARVLKLREQLDRRKTARDEIIGLRLKTITNDAAGLGFPGSVDVFETLAPPLVPNGAADGVLRSGNGAEVFPEPILDPGDDLLPETPVPSQDTDVTPSRLEP